MCLQLSRPQVDGAIFAVQHPWVDVKLVAGDADAGLAGGEGEHGPAARCGLAAFGVTSQKGFLRKVGLADGIKLP
jgi:hypothetical protein